MSLKTNIGVFSVYHEEHERIMRCVYDSINAMVIGYVDFPEDESDEAKDEYHRKIKALKDKHTEWAKTATADDIVTVQLSSTAKLKESIVHATGEV